MIDEMEALKNLKRMASMGWVGAYGFYEAGDYQKSLKKPALTKEWMAHHQGMSLLAVLNLLHNNIAQEWFHANANLKATELLLHEKPIRESLLLAEYRSRGSGGRRRDFRVGISHPLLVGGLFALSCSDLEQPRGFGPIPRAKNVFVIGVRPA